MSGDEERRIAAAGHVRIYGDTWVVDKREPPAPLDAYSLNEREPNVFEWLFLDGTEPHRSVGASPDPWLTWEWRTHLGQSASLPTGEPATLDQMRIAHTVAVASGDQAAAARWRSPSSRAPSARCWGVSCVGSRAPVRRSWPRSRRSPSA